MCVKPEPLAHSCPVAFARAEAEYQKCLESEVRALRRMIDEADGPLERIAVYNDPRNGSFAVRVLACSDDPALIEWPSCA